MLDEWKRERQIRKVLSGLARQRVAMILQPQGVWVIERALQRDEDTEAALMTCHMRGWVEPLHDSMPTGDLTPDMKLPSGPLFTRTQTVFRLTEGGWSALNRAHAWTVAGIVIAILSLIATIAVAS
ncbi:hypothetical protein GCM10011380_34650 [Sphingomonas metalli]|jgi:hypothetical protein|uniref:Uncharacterized protein n=1 Tax=Sphingomonas metalli TaxID=1779358 RepID=A0A916TET0_9SPHN|nr:hypothetical protein [Sphingomonas metalli]GGB42229.1 hypothetical protein GCM10011380_34650 [Sphingomonas metalli]